MTEITFIPVEDLFYGFGVFFHLNSNLNSNLEFSELTDSYYLNICVHILVHVVSHSLGICSLSADCQPARVACRQMKTCIFLVFRACSFTAQALGNEQHRSLTTASRRKNFKSLDMKCSQNSLVLLLGEIVAEKWSEMFGFGNFR